MAGYDCSHTSGEPLWIGIIIGGFTARRQVRQRLAHRPHATRPAFNPAAASVSAGRPVSLRLLPQLLDGLLAVLPGLFITRQLPEDDRRRLECRPERPGPELDDHPLPHRGQVS